MLNADIQIYTHQKVKHTPISKENLNFVALKLPQNEKINL